MRILTSIKIHSLYIQIDRASSKTYFLSDTVKAIVDTYITIEENLITRLKKVFYKFKKSNKVKTL